MRPNSTYRAQRKAEAKVKGLDWRSLPLVAHPFNKRRDSKKAAPKYKDFPNAQ